MVGASLSANVATLSSEARELSAHVAALSPDLRGLSVVDMTKKRKQDEKLNEQSLYKARCHATPPVFYEPIS